MLGDLLNKSLQAFQRARLDEVTVCAAVISPCAVVFFVDRGEDDDGYPLGGGRRLDLPQDFKPVHAWHIQIQQDQVGAGIGLAVGIFLTTK